MPESEPPSVAATGRVRGLRGLLRATIHDRAAVPWVRFGPLRRDVDHVGNRVIAYSAATLRIAALIFRASPADNMRRRGLIITPNRNRAAILRT